MGDVFAIAASGLAAAQAGLNVTANNIANLNTPGFTAQRAVLATGPTGGVEVEGTESTGESPDLATQLVNLKQSALMYGANAMVIRTADQMYGSLLNVLDTENSNIDGNNG